MPTPTSADTRPPVLPPTQRAHQPQTAPVLTPAQRARVDHIMTLVRAVEPTEAAGDPTAGLYDDQGLPH